MTDEQQVRLLWQTMADAWERGDAAGFAGVFAEDVDFVNVRGEEQLGRAQVEAGHAALFETVYRGTRMVPEVRLVRPLADGAYLVHAASEVLPPGTRTHAQAVVARRDGEWSIAAFHNMIPMTPKN